MISVRKGHRQGALRVLLSTLAIVALAVPMSAGLASATGPLPMWPDNPNWQALVPGPASTDVHPTVITRQTGNVTNAAGLTGANPNPTVLTMVPGGPEAVVVLDFGREVGGYPYVNVSANTPTSPATSNTLRVSTSESLGYLNGSGNTTLSASAAVGDINVKVASVAVFAVSPTITIDTGAASETRNVVGVGTAAAASTTLVAAANAGDTNINVASVTGYAVGGPLTIDTGASLENATITAVGTAAGTATTTSLAANAGDTNVKVASVSGFTVGGSALVGTGATAQKVSVTAVGTAASSTTLAAPAAIGDTNVSVAAITGLAVGGTLVVDSTGTPETVTISAVGTAAGTAGTTLAATAVGATVIPVSSISGYVVGQKLLIDTGANAERATVSAIGVAGASTTIPAAASTTLAVTSTTLSAATTAGATTVQVSGLTGFTPGMTIGIDSGAAAETATVASMATTGLPVPSYSATPVADWIWNTAGAASSAPSGTIYVRKDFTIADASAVTAAALRTNVDDSEITYVNGIQVDSSSGSNAWQTSHLTNIAPYLVTGNNVIACACTNGSSAGSMIAAVEIDTSSTSTRIVSDASWLGLSGANITPPTGWNTASFNDSAWPAMYISGVYPISPWNTLSNPTNTSTYSLTFTAPLANAHAAATILGSVTPAGVTNIKVASVTGFSAGQSITIDSGANLETATISAVGTAGSAGTGIDLVAPTTLVHTGAVTVGLVAAPIGATNIHVTSVTGFVVGHTMTVDTGAALESVVISAVGTAGATGTGVTFSPALTKVHSGGATVRDLGTGITVSALTLAHASGVAIRGLGTGVTFTPALASAHVSGATLTTPGTGVVSVALLQAWPATTAIRGLGTGITFTPALAAAHANGATVGSLGTGVTLDSPLSSAHASGTRATGLGAYQMDQGSQITLTVTTPNTYTGALRGGYRFESIELTTPGTVTLTSAGLNFIAYDGTPDKYQGWFMSSDAQLNALWYAGAYTGQMDVEPAGITTNGTGPCYPEPVMFDGAKRDRRVWAGDLALSDPVALISLGTNAAPFVQGSIDTLITAQAANGRIPSGAGYPSGCTTFNYSNTYAAYAAELPIQYYRYSGNAAYTLHLLPQLERAVAYQATLLDANGLIVSNDNDYWQVSQSGEVTEYSLAYYELLQNMAWLESQIGTPAMAAQYTANAAALKTAINTRLYNTAAGMYQRSNTAPTTYMTDASSNVIRFGVASPSQDQGILDYLKANWTAHGSQISPSDATISDPYGHYVEPVNNTWEVMAFLQAGDAPDAMALLNLLWGPEVDPSNPFYTGANWEYGVITGASDSLSHAWGGGPTQAITEGLVGITPVGPGYSTWQVKPQTAKVGWAENQVPTAGGGALSVKWAQDLGSGAFHMQVVSPSGTSGQIWVPSAAPGDSSALLPGATFVARSGYYDEYTVGSGTFEFSSVLDTTAPVTSATATPAAPSGTNIASYSVALNATDDASGVASTSYTLDGGATQTYLGPITLSAGTTHTVQYWSTDNVGNVEATNSLTLRYSTTAIGVTLDATASAGTTPTIYIGGTTNPSMVREDGVVASSAPGVTYLGVTANSVEYGVVAGTYHFSDTWGYTVSGSFTAGGAPQTGGTVYAFTGAGAYAGSSAVDGSGNYSFSLAPGTYKFYIAPASPGYPMQWFGSTDGSFATATTVTVSGDTTQALALAGVYTISGAFTAGGVAQAGGTVYVFNGAGNYVGSALADGSGNYSFSFVPAGSYKLYVAPTSPGYATQWFGGATFATATSVAVSGNTTADVALAGVYDLSGNFTAGGVPQAGGTVYAFTAGSYSYVGSAAVDGSGNYDFGFLPTGSYKLFLAPSSAGYGMQWFGGSDFASAATVALTAATVQNISLIGEYTLSGNFTAGGSPQTGGALYVFTAGGSYVGSASIDNSGHYSFGYLAAGSYKIYLAPASAGYGLQWYGGADFASATTFNLSAPSILNIAL